MLIIKELSARQRKGEKPRRGRGFSPDLHIISVALYFYRDKQLFYNCTDISALITVGVSVGILHDRPVDKMVEIESGTNGFARLACIQFTSPEVAGNTGRALSPEILGLSPVSGGA